MTANLLTKPLSSFHSEFTSIFEEWPKKEMASEIVRRVIIAVAALFAYPVYGCLYLMSKFYDSFHKSDSGTQPTQPPKKCINISERMDGLKRSLLKDGLHPSELTDFTQTNIKTIKSMKIFFNLYVGENSQSKDNVIIKKDYVIIKNDKSAFDEDFFRKKIQSIINELGELIPKKTDEKLEFVWEALTINTNGTFTRVFAGPYKNGRLISGSNPDISERQVGMIMKSLLQDMGRELTPQFKDGNWL